MNILKRKIILALILLFAFSFKTFANESITFTLQGAGNITFCLTATLDKPFTINWGDGTPIETDTGRGYDQAYFHWYQNSSYTVTITGQTSDCFFSTLDVGNGSYMDLTSLDVTNCLHLTHLFCHGKLTHLDLSNNVNIKYLNCSENLLTNLDISQNFFLTYLNCSNNQLTCLDLSNNQFLLFLNCSNNQLTEISTHINKYLEYLDCSNNQLSFLSLWDNKLLTRLNCSYNRIDNSGFGMCSYLEELRCANNHLEFLETGINLRVLNCSANQLKFLNVGKSESLMYLYCSDNQLSNLDISNNKYLYNLDCSNNQLSVLDVSCSISFEIIDCRNNQLKHFVMGSNQSIAYLVCSNNKLQSVNFSKNQLKSLYCLNNQIPLSELFAISQKFEFPLEKGLGTQILEPKEVKESYVDFSSQYIFSGIKTVFTVEKNGAPAPESDYHINNGFISFYTQGNFRITMTNDAIVSNPDYPAVVIAEVIVREVGVAETQHASSLQIYPNPVSNILYINLENTPTPPEVKIYSLQGVLVLQTNGNQIDVSALPAGFYVANVNGINRKIIKQY